MQSLLPERPWLKFYPPDLPASIDYPKIPVYSLLTESAKAGPSQTALVFQGKRLTYGELNRLSNRFANGLKVLGISKGDRIAIILPNIPQFVICFYGALKTGAVVVPTNPIYREKELEFQLENSGAVVAVILNNISSGTDFYSEFEKCRSRLSKIRQVFVTSITDFLPPIKKQLAGPVKKIQTVRRNGTLNLVDFLRKQSDQAPGQKSGRFDPLDEIAVLQYTGGTTGISKGAMLTHYNLVSNAIVANRLRRGKHGESATLAVIPFFHIYGLTSAMNAPVQAGEKIILLPRFDPDEVLDVIENEKINVFPGVPAMYLALIHHPSLLKHSLSSIKVCVSGAAPLPAEVQKRFNQITGGHLVEGYGLTEASPITHANLIGSDVVTKAGSIGIPVPDTDAKIVDIETGLITLPVGDVGELAVKGPQVMKGYWNNPSETANIFRGEWMLTGDIVKRDEDGFFYVVDRKKDMIDVSGFKVWPREVEEVLFSHPDVKDVAVIGIDDDRTGEAVKAFVVLKDKNKNPGADALLEFCRERIAPFKTPKAIEFREDLPKTLVGKVLRRKLREEEKNPPSA